MESVRFLLLGQDQIRAHVCRHAPVVPAALALAPVVHGDVAGGCLARARKSFVDVVILRAPGTVGGNFSFYIWDQNCKMFLPQQVENVFGTLTMF